MIKLILDHKFSKRDINGNCYWATTVTSTRTGKEFTFSTPHYSNSEGLVDLDWNKMHSTTEELPIREFNRFCKNNVTKHNSCKSEEIKALIKKMI